MKEQEISQVNMVSEDELIERELKQEKRREKKRLEYLSSLGLDENGEPIDNFPLSKYPVREVIFRLPNSTEPIALNPVVTQIGVICLWGVVAWNRVDPTRSLKTITEWRSTVSMAFSPIYQAVKVILFFFLIYVTYKYGHIHMGRKGDKPEFSNLTYFCMMFVSGVGPSLLIYSVSETLWHQTDNFFVKAGYRSQDEIDLFATNMTISNWGICSWTHFTIVGICLAVAVHRFQLPLTFRTCFYPILRHYTWGWIGDVIDGMSIVVTITVLCIHLGLLGIQVLDGLVHLGFVDEMASAQEIDVVRNCAVWIVTVLSTASIIYGLRGAIQFLSRLAMGLGCMLLLLVFVMDDSKFLLNLQVQEIGYFLQYSIFQLNFWTDAFGQLREGSGRAVDGKAAEQWWMDAWLVFYNAWILAFTACVGMFYARVSKGRKLWEIVAYGFVGPICFCLVWFCVWGGSGLRQSRQSRELQMMGEIHFNNSGHYLADGSEFCYEVPQSDVVIGDTIVFHNYLPGVTPVCQFDPSHSANAVYNVLNSFLFPETFGEKGMGQVLSVLFLIGCVLFYIACSDSITLMVDSLACNGRKNNHWVRRVFWTCTIGAMTTTLLSAGGDDPLGAIEVVIVVTSTPIAIFMFYIIQSTLSFCQAADKSKRGRDYQFPEQPEFSMPVYGGIFNAMEYATSLGRVNGARVELGMDRPTRDHVFEFVKGIVIPFASLHQILHQTYPENPKTNGTVVACYAICYIGFMTLLMASSSYPGLSGVWWVFFAATGGILCYVRTGYRTRYSLRSNVIADVTSSLFLWPQVLAQLNLQCHENKGGPKESRDKNSETKV